MLCHRALRDGRPVFRIGLVECMSEASSSNQSDIEPLVTALIHAVKMERDEFHERCNNSYSTDALMLCKERVALCKAAVLAAMRPAHAAEPSAARRAEYWKAEHLAGNAEIERLQQRLQQRVHELERELTAVRSSHDSLVAQRAAEPPSAMLLQLLKPIEMDQLIEWHTCCEGLSTQTDDFNGASMHRQRKRELIAIRAREPVTKSVQCSGYVAPRLSLQDLPCIHCGKLQAEHKREPRYVCTRNGVEKISDEASASDTFNGPFGTVRTGVCTRCFSESHVLSQKRGICIRCAESETPRHE